MYCNLIYARLSDNEALTVVATFGAASSVERRAQASSGNPLPNGFAS